MEIEADFFRFRWMMREKLRQFLEIQMDMMLLKGCERGSSVNSRVFFLSKSVFCIVISKKQKLRGNSERIPTTIVVPHNYECSFKGELITII